MNNVNILLTPNYHVQKMFMTNQCDYYFEKVIAKDEKDINQSASCVQDSKTGDIILKMVNYNDTGEPMKVNLNRFGKIAPQAEQTVLSGQPGDENTFEILQKVVPVTSVIEVAKSFEYAAPAMSLTVIRIKPK